MSEPQLTPQITSAPPCPPVTSAKPKDPKKVEAGRRLGQISKQIREQRMRERIESEMGWGYGYLIGIAGLVLAGISIYYARAEHNRVTQKPEPKPEPKNVNIKGPNFLGLDSL